MAAAKEFGIDLTLVLRRLTLTPDERADDLEGALAFVEVVRLRSNLPDDQLS